MELVKLELQGFRGFKNKQVVYFPEGRRPLVFVGINGAGKTALLDAIRCALSPLHDNILGNTTSASFGLNFQDINIDVKSASILLKWKYPNHDSDSIYQTKITLNRAGLPIIENTNADDLAKDINRNIEAYKNQYSLAVMALYPSERLVLKADVDKTEGQTSDQRDALINSFGGFIDYKIFFQWFRTTEDIENEKRLTEDNTYSEPALQAVKKAIFSFLDNFSELRVQRSPVTDLVVKKEGKKLSINQLSSGEKAVLTMVGDLARRLAMANPGLLDPLKGRGIVLIDEVEMHLHPSWQVKIVSQLEQVFPNIQFILTTHSALVINHLPTEQLYFLKDNECYPATQSDLRTYAADIETVLAWQGLKGGTIPKNISQKINKIDGFIRNKELEKAREELKILKQEIYPSHPLLRDLETNLQIKELGL